MKNLWSNLDDIKTRLKKPLILLLDFDGTLSSVSKTPSAAFLPSSTRQTLEKLSIKDDLYIVLVSGRKLENLKEKVGLSKIIYGGNHGLEGEIFGFDYLFPIQKSAFKDLSPIKNRFYQLASVYAGSFIEDKIISFSFHYRNVDKKFLPSLVSDFKNLIKDYQKSGVINLIAGKKVFDIQPNVKWNKGYFAKLVIQNITERTGKIPGTIFIGDDLTDEQAFRMLPEGINIQVGKTKKFHTNFFLANTKEVAKFLNWLVANV